MTTVSLDELQRDLHGYLARVSAGESLLLIDGERRIAEVRPAARMYETPRPFGLCAGQFSVPDDFDEPLSDDILEEFEGQ